MILKEPRSDEGVPAQKEQRSAGRMLFDSAETPSDLRA